MSPWRPRFSCFNLNAPAGFPFFNGSARLGPEDDLHISASYARSLPGFSGDDVEVGMATGVFEDGLVWVGASMPINRDVVAFKAVGRVRPVRTLEVTATGRFGKTEWPGVSRGSRSRLPTATPNRRRRGRAAA